MIWRRDIIDFSKEAIEHKKMSSKELEEYINSREKLILDDYVVNDWHVSKKFGLGKFGKVGAYVVDEDTSLIGDKEKADKYKAFYIEIKEKMESGNTYADVDTEGYIAGIGYNHDLSNNGISVRAEVVASQFDDVSTNNGVASTGNRNVVQVESMWGVRGTISVVKSF